MALVRYDGSINTTVLSGLPVTVRYTTRRPDESEGAGMKRRVVDDYEVVSRTGKPFGPWLNKRIAETKGEEDRILDACQEEIDNPPYYD